MNIVGLGYTIYPAREYEAPLMAEAGELIALSPCQRPQLVLWIYPHPQAR